MDSFFDQPRNAPEPISIEKFAYMPGVPEVSMISNNKIFDNLSSENAWKMNYQQVERHNFQQNNVPGFLHENFCKKQVRFESPPLQNKHNLNNTPSNKKIETSNGKHFSELSAVRKQHLENLRSNDPKPFEKIYMANIPDSKLDLSLLDISEEIKNSNAYSEKKLELYKSDKSEEFKTEEPVKICENKSKEKVGNKENYMPKTYHDFLELQKKMTQTKQKEHNDSVTDIFNYKKNKLQSHLPSEEIMTNTTQQKTDKFLESRYQEFRFSPPNYQHKPMDTCLNLVKQTYGSEIQTHTGESSDSNALQNRKECEVSNADLLKIIAQQNEQLLLLQRQVATLLDRDRRYPKQIEAFTETEIPSNERIKYNFGSTPQKNHFRQENTITQQAGIFQDNQRKWGMSKFSINLTTSFEMPIRTQQKQNFVNHEPRIQEITESDLSPKTDNLETSFHLQEPLDIRENCPSPQPSININMNDYESSDDEEGVSEIGTTFYNNLMGQVNNMLRKGKRGTEGKADDEKSQMLNKVKEATLRHLKDVGISVDTIDKDFGALENEGSKNYTPSEISCTVKQLLMKYLPQDQLNKQKKPMQAHQEPSIGLISPRPEFSIASLEYMRKYNLIPSKEKVPDFIQPNKIVEKDWAQGNKRILDLTALKMQPKLM